MPIRQIKKFVKDFKTGYKIGKAFEREMLRRLSKTSEGRKIIKKMERRKRIVKRTAGAVGVGGVGAVGYSMMRKKPDKKKKRK